MDCLQIATEEWKPVEKKRLLGSLGPIKIEVNA